MDRTVFNRSQSGSSLAHGQGHGQEGEKAGAWASMQTMNTAGPGAGAGDADTGGPLGELTRDYTVSLGERDESVVGFARGKVGLFVGESCSDSVRQGGSGWDTGGRASEMDES